MLVNDRIEENMKILFFYELGYNKREVGKTEVSFVAENPNERLYIQVTESVQSSEARECELRPL